MEELRKQEADAARIAEVAAASAAEGVAKRRRTADRIAAERPRESAGEKNGWPEAPTKKRRIAAEKAEAERIAQEKAEPGRREGGS